MLPMLRGTFFSIGMFIALWGVSLLFVDKLVVNVADDTHVACPGLPRHVEQPAAEAAH